MKDENSKTDKLVSKVSIPKDMELEFRILAREDKALGFDSWREFVKDSVRNNILKYREIIQDRKKMVDGVEK